MKRLINADELKSDIISKMYLAQKEYLHKSHIIHQIDIAPTVDAVEVVRCKDCKHYDKDALWCNINSPMFSEEHYNWYEDDYCSCGERRTDERKADGID